MRAFTRRRAAIELLVVACVAVLSGACPVVASPLRTDRAHPHEDAVLARDLALRLMCTSEWAILPGLGQAVFDAVFSEAP